MSTNSKSATLNARNWDQQKQINDQNNEITLSHNRKIASAEILKDLYESITHLLSYTKKLSKITEQQSHSPQSLKIQLREDCKPANYFCQCLERCLLFGFKKHGLIWSSTLWNFILSTSCKSFDQCLQLSTDINLIKSIEQLNDNGKFRAFLRQALRSKCISIYFELILQQSDIIQEYYYDYGIMSGAQNRMAFNAQLQELDYISNNVYFEMLLSDKSLNIFEYFKNDRYAIPQWMVNADKGDIMNMVNNWILQNRDILILAVNESNDSKKHRKKRKSKKRKLKRLMNTDQIRDGNERPVISLTNEQMIDQIIANVDKEEVEQKRRRKKSRIRQSRRKKRKRKRAKISEIVVSDDEVNDEFPDINIDQILDNIPIAIETETIKLAVTPMVNEQNNEKVSETDENVDDAQNNNQSNEASLLLLLSGCKNENKEEMDDENIEIEKKENIILSNEDEIDGHSSDLQSFSVIEDYSPKTIIRSIISKIMPGNKHSPSPAVFLSNSPVINSSPKPTIFRMRSFPFLFGENSKSHVRSSSVTRLQINRKPNANLHPRNLFSQKLNTFQTPAANSPSFSDVNDIERCQMRSRLRSKSSSPHYKKIEDLFSFMPQNNTNIIHCRSISDSNINQKSVSKNDDNVQHSKPKLSSLAKQFMMNSTLISNEENKTNDIIDECVGECSIVEQSVNILTSIANMSAFPNSDKIITNDEVPIVSIGDMIENESRDISRTRSLSSTPISISTTLSMSNSVDQQNDEKEDDEKQSTTEQKNDNNENESKMNKYPIPNGMIEDEYDTDEDDDSYFNYPSNIHPKQRIAQKELQNLFYSHTRQDHDLLLKVQKLDENIIELKVNTDEEYDEDIIYNSHTKQSITPYQTPSYEPPLNSHQSTIKEEDIIVPAQYRFSLFLSTKYKEAKMNANENQNNDKMHSNFNMIGFSPSNNSSITSNSTQNTSSSSSHTNSAAIAHAEIVKEGGSTKRDELKKNVWHSGLEIEYRHTPLPPRDNEKLLLQQRFHCATCGMVLKSNFLRRARYHYCRYTGLLHCNNCHINERAYIPHHILHELDCKQYTVCRAAKKYLDSMLELPCISMDMWAMDVLNKNKKIQELAVILRELQCVKEYVQVCHSRKQIYMDIGEYEHFLKHAGSISLQDCINVIVCNIHLKLRVIVRQLKKHIMIDCDMCRLRGHLCEICKDHQVIYSFQFDLVYQCQKCKACFHQKCWKLKVNQICPRCLRRLKKL